MIAERAAECWPPTRASRARRRRQRQRGQRLRRSKARAAFQKVACGQCQCLVIRVAARGGVARRGGARGGERLVVPAALHEQQRVPLRSAGVRRVARDRLRRHL